jgi:hypothetical protein
MFTSSTYLSSATVIAVKADIAMFSVNGDG